MFELCGVLDLHVETEVPQPLKKPLRQPFLVAVDEVLIAEIVKFHAVAEHVVDVSEHGRGDREDGLLRAATAFEPEELAVKIAVLFASGGPRRLDEGGLQPWRALTGPCRAALAGAFI